MRVGILATEVGSRGGIQRYGSLVQRAIEDAGHDVVLRESIAWPSTRERVTGLASLAREIRGADALWVLHPRLLAAGTAVASLQRMPLVVSTHGFETWGHYSPLQRVLMGRAAVVTAVSKFSLAMMGSPARHAILMPPTWGVEVSPDSVLTPPIERRIVLFVGRLGAVYKGADIFLSLASEASEHHPDWRFVMAGSGPVDSALTTRVRELSAVQLLPDPSDADLAATYAQAAILMLPSRAERGRGNRWVSGEGFGIVLLEAARHGVTVISSDEGACPEVVASLGNGIVCPPDRHSFADAMGILMVEHEMRTILGLRGMDQARRKFSPDAFLCRVRSVLAAAVHGNR